MHHCSSAQIVHITEVLLGTSCCGVSWGTLCASEDQEPGWSLAPAIPIMATSSEYAAKVKGIWESMAGQEGKRWARPESPILHNLNDEKEEPLVFFHNTNYRISRKYINVEKVKVLRQQLLECVRSTGHARHHKCMEVYKRFQASVRVASNVDRGPLARKRDVGFIYHHNRMRELQQQAAELEVDFPFRKS